MDGPRRLDGPLAQAHRSARPAALDSTRAGTRHPWAKHRARRGASPPRRATKNIPRRREARFSRQGPLRPCARREALRTGGQRRLSVSATKIK
jgi:hypothetical protein